MDDLPSWLPPLLAQLNRIEALASRRDAVFTGIISTPEAMRLLGYEHADSFLRAVKNDRIPYVRVNARRIMFDPVVLNEWKQNRTRNAPKDC